MRGLITMVVLWVTSFSLYVFGGGVNAAPLGWKGNPLISSIADMPAICLPQGAEPFPVYRVMVSESFLEKSAYWAIYLEPDAPPVLLNSGECLRFGDDLKGYRSEGGLVISKLKPNFTYSFSMDRVNDAKHYNYFYSAAFCVLERSTSTHQYPQYIRLTDGAEIIPSCDTRRNGSLPGKQLPVN